MIDIRARFVNDHARHVYAVETENMLEPAHDCDAGIDLCVTAAWDEMGRRIDMAPFDVLHTFKHDPAMIGFGVSIAIPRGWVGLIVERSSLYKSDLEIVNKIGIIDSGYRGELRAVLRPRRQHVEIRGGQRIAQLVIVPSIFPGTGVQIVDHNEVTVGEWTAETDRGAGGFGSTG